MKKSEQALALATATVLGIAAGWTWVAKPLIEDYTDARDRVERAQDQLARAQEILKRRKAVESDRAVIQGALQDADPVSAFLNHLHALADAAGFREASVRHVRADPFGDAFAELRFELKARAPLKQIEDFLVRMAASDWYLRVQALSVQPREDGTVEVDVSLVALATQDALEEGERKGGKPR